MDNNERLEFINKVIDNQIYNKATKLEYPKKLYKYRQATDEKIKSLENEEAYFASPCNWRDKTDISVLIELEKENEYLENNKKEIIKDFCKKMIKSYMHYNRKAEIEIRESEIEKVVNHSLESEEINYKYLFAYYKNNMSVKDARMKIENLKIEYENMKNKINDYFILLKKIINYKEDMAVLCLSERYDISSQWDNYACGGNGFCIEYDIEKLAEEYVKNLLPVYYGEKENIKAYDILENVVLNCFDNEKIKEIALDFARKVQISFNTKDTSYSNENEWRISLNGREKVGSHILPCISSIILGDEISKENELRLIDIARKKGYKVYKKTINITNSAYKYKELLDNKEEENGKK